MKAKPSTLKQQLSKDMKKQGHVSKKKPNNKNLSSEESLSETPKKGTYREPNSKKLSSETSLQKSHKLVHLKEFSQFMKENTEFDIDRFKKLYRKYKDSLLKKTGLDSRTLDDKWSDFVSDLIGDEWKYENKNDSEIIDDFIKFE